MTPALSRSNELAKKNLWSVKYFITCYPQLQPLDCTTTTTVALKPHPLGPPTADCKPTVTVLVEVNGVQVENGPLNLPLERKLAVGTRVEQQEPPNRRGTVISSSDIFQMVPVGSAYVQ